MSSTDLQPLPSNSKTDDLQPLSSDSKTADLDPKQADKISETEFKSKYPGFGNRPSGLAQRKISSTGGKQYFDSGDYNKSASRKEKHQMASFPHAMNPQAMQSHPTGIPPHLAHMRAKPRPSPSKLAVPTTVPPGGGPLAD